MGQHLRLISLLLVCIWSGFWIYHGQFATVQSDVSALNVLYSSLNSPSQLTGWTSKGGDPCGQLWKGITCSSSVITEIKLSGMRLNGTLGYLLANLLSVSTFDVSNNNIGVGNQMPYGLPPNVQWLDISGNSFVGGLPYSISQMSSLRYLNVSHNQLQESLNDMFWNLSRLSVMDLSFNNFSSELPQSFGNLSSLTTLYLQNNSFSGTVDILVNLPLENLNLANNNFTRPVPEKLKQVKNFPDKNIPFSFHPGSVPPTGQRSSPHSGHGSSSSIMPSDKGQGKRRALLSSGVIAVIIIAGLVVGSILALFIIKSRTRFSNDGKEHEKNHPITAATNKFEKANQASTSFLMNKNSTHSHSSTTTVPPGMNPHKLSEEEACSSSGKLNTVTSFSVADLQMATESFSVRNLVGEGSVGSVYRAQFGDGKVLAIKNVSSYALGNEGSQSFLDIVKRLSRFHHPNILELVGYCCQHGQNLLVYKFQKNGSLGDLLHSTNECKKILTWNIRIKIALGVARALEYLHEVCSPSVVHKNLKSSKVLLDEDFNCYLADCGMDALVDNVRYRGFGRNSDSKYCAADIGMNSCKSDVYSFGVLMLELLTGREPFDSSRRTPEKCVVQWATPQLYDIDRLIKMVDPTLKGQFSAKSLSRFADVIALCVQPEARFRPPMSEVIQSLIRLVQRTNMGQRMDYVVELGWQESF